MQVGKLLPSRTELPNYKAGYKAGQFSFCKSRVDVISNNKPECRCKNSLHVNVALQLAMNCLGVSGERAKNAIGGVGFWQRFCLYTNRNRFTWAEPYC
jgi:hypothetical protein